MVDSARANSDRLNKLVPVGISYVHTIMSAHTKNENSLENCVSTSNDHSSLNPFALASARLFCAPSSSDECLPGLFATESVKLCCYLHGLKSSLALATAHSAERVTTALSFHSSMSPQPLSLTYYVGPAH